MSSFSPHFLLLLLGSLLPLSTFAHSGLPTHPLPFSQGETKPKKAGDFPPKVPCFFQKVLSFSGTAVHHKTRNTRHGAFLCHAPQTSRRIDFNSPESTRLTFGHGRKSTVLPAHLGTECAKHSAFSRERHKYGSILFVGCARNCIFAEHYIIVHGIYSAANCHLSRRNGRR